jgi:hypothetical protein
MIVFESNSTKRKMSGYLTVSAQGTAKVLRPSYRDDRPKVHENSRLTSIPA